VPGLHLTRPVADARWSSDAGPNPAGHGDGKSWRSGRFGPDPFKLPIPVAGIICGFVRWASEPVGTDWRRRARRPIVPLPQFLTVCGITSHPPRLFSGGEKQPAIASARAHRLLGLSLYRTRPAVRRRDFMSGGQRPPALPWSRPDAADPGVSRWQSARTRLRGDSKTTSADSRLSLRESSAVKTLLSRSERRLSAACRSYS